MSFLTFVAEKGTIFYINNNKSNLENIKASKLYDVLIWASEQKDYEETINSYYDSLNP
jgi:ribosomal protein L24E